MDSEPDVVDRPASVLAAVRQAFTALATAPPAPVCLDARGLGHGLPDRPVPLAELQHLLLDDPTVGLDAKDAVWHRLVEHARTWGQPWTVVALGVAMPRLISDARRLSLGNPDQDLDIESGLVEGFLDALLRADLDGRGPCAKLCWAGFRAARRARRGEDWSELPDLPEPTPHLPTHPYGHPDLLLGRAARAGIITWADAELISATRLGRDLVEDHAARQGVTPAALRMRRRRAEKAVAAAIARGLLSSISYDATSAKRPASSADSSRYRGRLMAEPRPPAEGYRPAMPSLHSRPETQQVSRPEGRGTGQC